MAITNWWSSVWTKRGLFGTDFKKQQVYVCSRTIHATVSLTGSESQPLHALPMFCIRLPPSVGIRWGIVCPAACSLFVFVLTGISSGGVSTWAKLADVEVIMTLKVLLSLARGVFPDLMCSVSWIRRTTSALGVGTYSMCGWRWKDGKMMWAVWQIPHVQPTRWPRHPQAHRFPFRPISFAHCSPSVFANL